MPELPEVEFCRRSLHRWSAGARFHAVEVRDPRSVRRTRTTRPSQGDPDGAERLRAVVLGAPPDEPRRVGKRILWSFGDGALLLHLGMTGRWTRRDGPHVKVALLTDGGPLYFADPRLLGGVVPTTRGEGEELLIEGLGPDALAHPLPRLTGRRPVKVALMDQAVVAGLGNLHAAEALWRAGIAPTRPCESLTDAEHTRLDAAVREQLLFALATLGPGEEIEYVEDAGAPNPFPVYGQAGRPCPRCGSPIGKLVQAGRTTWFCPGCQPGTA